jgi:hypothetical protein
VNPHRCTDFLCQVADPLRFEDPPAGASVDVQTWSRVDKIAATSWILCSECPAPSHPAPFLPTHHECFTTSTTLGSSTSIDSQVVSPASVTSLLLDCPTLLPRSLPLPRAPRLHFSHLVSGVDASQELLSGDEIPFPRLDVSFSRWTYPSHI